ncbi:hypothetical protein K474DRAFT_1691814 [Panus rudis PR-1116 ss-1]|nr:hypothetical protein K474DRAFT_1691814 [Panus rudis PR-1116 ss-1]
MSTAGKDKGPSDPLKNDSGWSVVVSEDWEVLGPFPVHAREQHFLSPSYPLNLSEPIDRNTCYSSSYPDNGTVTWSRAKSADGELSVTFPHVRWQSLRETEGWAALQHHSVLFTILEVVPPPAKPYRPLHEVPPKLELLVSLSQGSYFTIVPAVTTEENDSTPAKWYAGNIYDMNASPPHVVPLPDTPSLNTPTSYILFVSGDYEIRLFGDPRASDTPVPKLQLSLAVEINVPTPELAFLSSHDISPDFVDGWAFGDAVGLGVHSVEGFWEVLNVSTADVALVETISVEMLKKGFPIVPKQTRVIPIKIHQRKPTNLDKISIQIYATSEATGLRVYNADISIRHLPQWSPSAFTSIKATYFYANTPTAFLVTPPIEPTAEDEQRRAPILALHGAGVDIFSNSFWAEALGRQQQSWTIMPSGRTAWGLDWHGPSLQDAFATVSALFEILNSRRRWHPWRLPARDTRVVVMGHSNGGQGAWYLASRFPDRVIAVIPAAAYIKSQSYVPLTLSRSAHFIDPAIRAILESSLTPDDNDLFMSNLVDTPIFAIHGGDDENVPVWHTRELVSVVKTYKHDAIVAFKEDPGKGHWYPEVFANGEVQAFIAKALTRSPTTPPYGLAPDVGGSFTLTVSIPAESGSFHGWKIEELRIPGRLGRLTVTRKHLGGIVVRTQNVAIISIREAVLPAVAGEKVCIDEQSFALLPQGQGDQYFRSDSTRTWQQYQRGNGIEPRGRMQLILSTSEPFKIVIPFLTDTYLSAATRLAHDLDVYHKLDAEILTSEKVTNLSYELPKGNFIILGHATDVLVKALLAQERTPVRLHDGILHMNNIPIDKRATTLFLHPHPSNRNGLVLVVIAEDQTGLERALRLIPMRTGITLPDWIIVGDETDTKGAAGVIGAGVWGSGNLWSWNEAMSSI